MHHLATLLLLHCCLYIAIAACSMEALKRDHGAIGYLDSLVDGPGPVMQMLRDHAGVHTVILGSGDTEAQLSSNPQLLDKLEGSLATAAAALFLLSGLLAAAASPSYR
jgi:hypothetical protein